MTPSDMKRLALLEQFTKAFGREPAETLMENLPPHSWDQIATKADLEALKTELIARMDMRFTKIDDRFAKIFGQVDRVDGQLPRSTASSPGSTVSSPSCAASCRPWRAGWIGVHPATSESRSRRCRPSQPPSG